MLFSALEDGNRGASGEEEISHVRSSTRAVDGEKPEGGEGEAVDVVASVSNLFAGFLARRSVGSCSEKGTLVFKP